LNRQGANNGLQLNSSLLSNGCELHDTLAEERISLISLTFAALFIAVNAIAVGEFIMSEILYVPLRPDGPYHLSHVP
jgi:hypothetical protein